MTSLSKQQIYQRQRELQKHGWEWETHNFHGVNPHHGEETLRHYLVKAAVCNRIANRKGGRFVTEAEHPNRGQADIIDLRPAEDRALVIEIETGATRERRLEKSRQYSGPMVRQDAVVIDPTEAPADVDDWPAWLEDELP